jgi:predicted nucleotidyltransferase
MSGRVEWVLTALEQAGVRYLVVGGVAVVLHGYLRTTLDLDLVLQLDRDNLERALRAFSHLGFRPQAPVPLSSFADAQNRETWVREKNMTVFSLWQPDHPGFAVDLFIQEPFDFDAVYRRALRVPLQGVEATVVSRDDLLEMKRATGRARDLEDIEALSELPGEEA